MVKLLRFKYSDDTATAQDVRGFGKQPIAIGAYSSIALKNYNIKLVATLSNMLFTVTYNDDILFGFVEDGVAPESLTIPAGTYSAEELRALLQLNINALTEQNTQNDPKAYFTEVILQDPEAYLVFKTYVSPAATYALNNPNYFAVVKQSPGEVNLANPLVYDATAAADISKAVIHNGVSDLEPSIVMAGGDMFSFTVTQLGDGGFGEFRFAACLNGDTEDIALWGIGFIGDVYIYANNVVNEEEWESLGEGEVVPTVGDVVTYIRSGIQVHIFITREGADIYNKYVTLPIEILADLDGYLYGIGTSGAVIVSNLKYSMSSVASDEETTIQCLSKSLGLQLGFPNLDLVTSTDTDPATISLNKVQGAVNYEGIMVCINGLDLETYDFATEAEGKTNFLYTIQKEADINSALPINNAIGDLTNEPYIDMNNMSAMNINNKLSLYFLDTASSRKLEFRYADLLLIVK